jgi:hypothetical protein
MEITRLENALEIPDGATVRFKEMGNIFEIMHSKHRSKGGYITKLDKDTYCDNRTGEVKEFNHTESRADDLQNVAKSLCQGRDYLNTNITDVKKCRWLTLTYAENMTDPKKLQKDFEKFNERCRKVFGHYEYITAAEPQGRGAWHLHCVFIFKDNAPFMENQVVANLWKRGFVTVKKLDDVDNVGAYLTAYLGDMELDEATKENISTYGKTVKEIEFTDEHGQTQKKKYIKGARLSMYPPGFHIFRFSKGIKKPIVSNVPYGMAKEKIGSAKPTFSKSVALKDTENDFENELTYEYYNILRK